jgi:dTDP-4-amino-4,6-dideoxygalactose transaminase
MSVPFLDLHRQTVALRAELDPAIAAVIESGRFLMGAQLDAFEAEFAAFCSAAHCVGVASGTDALALALRAAGLGAGDEVITPALTCVPTVAAIVAVGARPVLIDVDADTLTLDPGRLEAAVTRRTRAVVPVHLHGRCADMEAIRPIARDRGLLVAEDAAHAHGARHQGRPVGSLGDVAAFSFYPTKNLGALGDAGAIVSDDGELVARARRLRAQGEDPELGAIVRSTHSRLDELQAAALRIKLTHLGAWNERRRAIADRYFAGLCQARVELPPEPAAGEHVFHVFAALSEDREGLRERLARRGIGTHVHYPRAVHQHPAYAELGHADLGRSEAAAARLVSLPLFPELTDREIDRVIAAVCDLG